MESEKEKYTLPGLEELDLIIERAMHGKHLQDKFLRNLMEANVALLYRNGLKRIARGFKKTLDALQADYLVAVEENSGLFEKLITYAQLLQCYKFYVDEIKIVSDLLKEYYNYVFDNRVLKTLLGYERPDEDLVPYTKKGRTEDVR